MPNPTAMLPRSRFFPNRCQWVLLGILAAASAAVHAAEPIYELRVVTDRADAIFAKWIDYFVLHKPIAVEQICRLQGPGDSHHQYAEHGQA